MLTLNGFITTAPFVGLLVLFVFGVVFYFKQGLRIWAVEQLANEQKADIKNLCAMLKSSGVLQFNIGFGSLDLECKATTIGDDFKGLVDELGYEFVDEKPSPCRKLHKKEPSGSTDAVNQ